MGGLYLVPFFLAALLAAPRGSEQTWYGPSPGFVKVWSVRPPAPRSQPQQACCLNQPAWGHSSAAYGYGGRPSTAQQQGYSSGGQSQGYGGGVRQQGQNYGTTLQADRPRTVYAQQVKQPVLIQQQEKPVIVQQQKQQAYVQQQAQPVFSQHQQQQVFVQQNNQPAYAPQGGAGRCARGVCVPLVLCYGLVSGVVLQTDEAACRLADGSAGLCCNRGPGLSTQGRSLFGKPFKLVDIRSFSVGELNEACRRAIGAVDRQRAFGRELLQRNVVVQPLTPDSGHLNIFKTSEAALRLGRGALVNAIACTDLSYTYRLTPDQAGFGLQRFSVLDTIINQTCPETPHCYDTALFRTADGSCNNLARPGWGRSRSALQRAAPPAYSDGVFRPRVASDGGPLPSARLVSTSVTGDENAPFSDLTISVMAWGQFIDHDLSITPIFRLDGPSGIECCDERGKNLPIKLRHPQCFPIQVPEWDPFFSKSGRECLNFVRSLPAPRPDCNFGYVEQLNSITHFLDASHIYGSDATEARQLRARQGGRLRESGAGRLPVSAEPDEECFAQDVGGECYLAGDKRVNENVQLAVMHTIWLREHNRVARALESLALSAGKQLTDEQLYQQARRIVTAEWQHITYHEWLPIVIGRQAMQAYGIETMSSGYSFHYRPDVNPSINNEFSAAAFRFGHSLIQNTIDVYGNGGTSEAIQLRDVLNNPSLLSQRQDGVAAIARGFYLQPSQRLDSNVATEVKNHLFQPPGGGQGLDLVALNIQRGRDHGIPSYNAMRQQCGLPPAFSFEDLYDVIPSDVVQRLRSVYRSVDDVDLFVAGIAERPVPGALLGPTFLCIIADQFARLKKADRFFYDLGGQPHSFTEEQLTEIRKTSWSRILCDNVPGIDALQPLTFYRAGPKNMISSCDSLAIPMLDLSSFVYVLE